MKQLTFEVNRTDWSHTRLVEEELPQALAEGEVLLGVDRFALTANNISYCTAGDSLGYWRFFPAEEGWGRVPVMGYGEVVASRVEGIEPGERVWGFFPMGTHLKIQAGNITAHGFKDVSAHREGLAPVYASFDRAAANPGYRPELEDLEMLFRGLFTTSWLVEDFLFDNTHFGASRYLITSASSKTSIALAFMVRQRGACNSVGITSAGNVAFVEQLGLYDQIVTYDDLEALEVGVPSVLVDMAGSAPTRNCLRRLLGDQLRYSCLIGATHYTEFGEDDASLPGASGEFFFAPAQIQKRNADWGAGEVMRRMGADLGAFYKLGASLVKVERRSGRQAVEDTFQAMLAGEASPERGYVLSLSGQ